MIYLIRFFGYFSTISAVHPIPNKEILKQILEELFGKIIKKVLSYTDSIEDYEEYNENNTLFIELVDSLALLSRGM